MGRCVLKHQPPRNQAYFWSTCKIPVVISPNGDQAILSGIGKINPSLDYLPENFYPDDKNLVYTSGKDGILVPGISIGKAFMENNRIKVKLFTDPTQIFLVNVVLSKSRKPGKM